MRFYNGEAPKGTIEEILAMTRTYAIGNLPYVTQEAVDIGNGPITRFASQLDYVTIKIATTKPSQLLAESKMRR